MAKMARTCLQTFLKAMNLIMGLVGISMILYGLWMIRVWQRDMEDQQGSSFDTFNSTTAWFIYSFIGIGVTFCFSTCLGHIAADSANGFCLSCYMVIICLLLLLETAMTTDILLNSDWEKDLPEDPTGRFHDFKEFIKSNFDFFKWIGLLIVLAQGSSTLLAMALRALEPNQCCNCDSDDEYPPLIDHHQVKPLPSYVVTDPLFVAKNESWNAKM